MLKSLFVLKLAKAKGVSRLEIDLDSTMVVEQINSGGVGGYEGWKLLKKIQELIRNTDWEVQVSHIYREANKCANAPATMACVQQTSLVFYASDQQFDEFIVTIVEIVELLQ